MNIEQIYRAEAGRVLATLVRLLGDLDLAEEALQEAFSVAIERWPREGVPHNTYAWLVSTGRFKAIDSLRKEKRGHQLLKGQPAVAQPEPRLEKQLVEDDQLRLIFYCCHPSLNLDARIALALREVCGMRTAEIATAYLTSSDAIKKRISRAKAQIRAEKIAYEIPSQTELKSRLNAVLHVIYLVFNEGYSASTGESHIKGELTREAIFLGRYLAGLLPQPEALGLLSLMLLQESRKEARLTAEGEIIALEEQQRSLWNHQLIEEGVELLQQVILSGQMGPYSLQAAIASVHALADSIENTRFDLIVNYYDILLKIQNSPIIALNRAIAVGMSQGPEAALKIIDEIKSNKQLAAYATTHAARAEFLLRLDQDNEAALAYGQALALAQSGAERRYLEKKLAEIEKKAG